MGQHKRAKNFYLSEVSKKERETLEKAKKLIRLFKALEHFIRLGPGLFHLIVTIHDKKIVLTRVKLTK